jgi:uncharacterized protein YbjT (DUF2867 family)
MYRVMINAVAVIGGSGFLGRATVEQLARAGKRVIVLCRNAERAKYLKPMGDVGQITIIAGNAMDARTLDQVIASADAVVNLVGILAEGGGQRFDKVQGELPGLIGAAATRHRLEALVHVSAIGADAESASRYARSKAAGEAAVKKAYPASVVLRPSVIFGPRDDFFNRFASMAMIAPALPLPGGGGMKMQPVYVDDVARAIVVALGVARPQLSPAGKTYELGGPDIFSFKQLMAMTLRHSERRRALVPVPFGLLSFGAAFAGLLPNPPITRDQVKLLKQDNVVAKRASGLADFGIVATSVESVLPSYLDRYRPRGLFRG